VTTERGGRLFQDAARRSIDQWTAQRRDIPAEWQESAARAIDQAGPDVRHGRGVARHIAVFSDRAYVAAFQNFLTGGLQNVTAEERRVMLACERSAGWDHSRALNEGSIAAGQATVPPYLDPAIILTNVGQANAYRQIATVKTITTQTWKGVTSAGVSAEWTAEASEMTDASPTFVQPSITPIRADAYVQASWEIVEDTSIAQDLAGIFADARDRLEATAFAVGTGSTQPRGVVTALQAVTASRVNATTNSQLGLIDIYALDSNLPPRYRPNASWTMNKGIANTLRQVTIPSLTNFSPWVDFAGAVPSKLIGYPYYESSGMQSSLSVATASNDDVIVLGDFRAGMFLVDRAGMQIAVNPMVLGSNRRPTGEIGWAMWYRVGSDVVNADAFRLLRV
jgi:HK97 family phage major capsid protein